MDVKNIGNFVVSVIISSLHFIAMFSLVRKPLFVRKGLIVFQNVRLLTKPFLKYLQSKPFWLIYFGLLFTLIDLKYIVFDFLYTKKFSLDGHFGYFDLSLNLFIIAFRFLVMNDALLPPIVLFFNGACLSSTYLNTFVKVEIYHYDLYTFPPLVSLHQVNN